MSDHDETASTPPRYGSTADQSRRLERVENRMDGVEQKVSDLTVLVASIEANQKSAAAIEELRFATVKTALEQSKSTMDAFIARIEGIINGTIQTAQTRQGEAIVAEYQAFKKRTEDRLDAVEDAGDRREAKGQGMVTVANATGRFIIILMAAVGGAVTVADFIAHLTGQ